MKVINVESWVGPEFAYNPGEEIELPDQIALARLEAGLAAPTASPLDEDRAVEVKVVESTKAAGRGRA